MPFQGESDHTLDEKNRVIMPHRHRSRLGDKFVITKGLDDCIWVLTDEEFRRIGEQLDSHPAFDDRAVFFQRFVSGSAVEATTDKLGRVSLPASLKEYAGIDRDVTIVGAGRRVEIWDKSRWQAWLKSMTGDKVKQVARELGVG